MGVRFCVLGSGSAGNAALVMTPRAHVLIDLGFTPDDLAARMEGTGAAWDSLKAVVLTHTHGDHLKKRTLKEIANREIPFFCHEGHAKHLQGGRYFKRLAAAGAVRTYSGREPFEVADGIRFLPLHLPHDCPPTYGFRIEALNGNGDERPAKLGYLADLGHERAGLCEAVADVDLLALEFNHDEDLERNSGRHPKLIDRVLGDQGHLSNRQAALVFENVLKLANGTGGPRLLVQMHLSEDCNRPDLAYKAAQEVVLRMGAHTKVFSTKQNLRGTVHEIA
ncbi:MAG: MBL fold metallo-hydrolase [Planctomycetota bacterium]|nr:MBL fold metallo-hydrolase [Planctomycetota bacterium]